MNCTSRGLIVVSSLLFTCSPLWPQQLPEIPYRSIRLRDWRPGSPQSEETGIQIFSSDVNSKGKLFVIWKQYQGQGQGQHLVELDADGKYLNDIAHVLDLELMPHHLKIDKQDNIWITSQYEDKVTKLGPDGRVLLVLGGKQKGSPKSKYSLFKDVDDIAFDTQSNIYISYLDGYINKLDKDGNLLKSWGERGDQPGQFKTSSHRIALDSSGSVYVVDVGNRRIQVFDSDGKFLRQFTIDVPAPPDARWPNGTAPTGPAPKPPWPVFALCITPGPSQFLYVSDAFPGRIYKLSLEGKVVGEFGKAGRKPGEFDLIHEISCPSENELYVTELGLWRVQKLNLQPIH